MTAKINLPEEIKALAQTEAEKILAELTGVSAVVVATVDGFNVASAISGSVEAARIAALASSIAAISTVVSQEANLGLSKSVTIDTESGFALVYSVRRTDAELVIHVIANHNAILAQVAYRAAQFSRKLISA